MDIDITVIWFYWNDKRQNQFRIKEETDSVIPIKNDSILIWNEPINIRIFS